MTKPPGIKRLKLYYDKVVSSFALKFNLRRYTTVVRMKKRWGFLHEELVLAAVESALLPTGSGGILEEFGPVIARKEATAAADIAKEAVKVVWCKL